MSSPNSTRRYPGQASSAAIQPIRVGRPLIVLTMGSGQPFVVGRRTEHADDYPFVEIVQIPSTCECRELVGRSIARVWATSRRIWQGAGSAMNMPGVELARGRIQHTGLAVFGRYTRAMGKLFHHWAFKLAGVLVGLSGITLAKAYATGSDWWFWMLEIGGAAVIVLLILDRPFVRKWLRTQWRSVSPHLPVRSRTHNAVKESLTNEQRTLAKIRFQYEIEIEHTRCYYDWRQIAWNRSAYEGAPLEPNGYAVVAGGSVPRLINAADSNGLGAELDAEGLRWNPYEDAERLDLPAFLARWKEVLDGIDRLRSIRQAEMERHE